MTPEYLGEVAEADARGRLAELYAEIRAVLGLPFVNLVYRHLAVDEERLAAVWAALGPNLASQAAADAAQRLVAAAAPPAVEPLPAGIVGAGEATLARATLDAYARGNSRNLLGMHALLDGCPGTNDRRPAPAPPAPRPILPMAALERLPEGPRALLDDMAVLVVGSDEPILVPSLLRHFVHNAPLLALLHDRLVAHAAELAMRREAVAAEARRLAADLPVRVEPLESEQLRTMAT